MAEVAVSIISAQETLGELGVLDMPEQRRPSSSTKQ
jgi:hypothetical protein